MVRGEVFEFVEPPTSSLGAIGMDKGKGKVMIDDDEARRIFMILVYCLGAWRFLITI